MDRFLTTPKRWFLPKMIDKALEKSVFTEADAIESAWQGITDDALRKYPSLKPAKFYHVPNGFDSADFPTPVAHENEVCTITYTGSMYGRRNPATLFQAIEQLIRDGQIQAERFRLRFIGRMGAEVMEMIEKTSFRDSIDIVPYVPHRESIRALQQADVTLLIVDEAKESAEIVPGKVFEYIGVNKPILALAPREGAAAQHILDSKSGWVVNQQDIQHIAKILLHIVTSFEQKTLQHSPDTDIIRTFERKEAAHSLAKIFTSLS
ncbi:MAG: glycosyltransferase [Ignavibacteria bacterium]|nr:glycosyltransferase [Ignavibacteria bacterium]